MVLDVGGDDDFEDDPPPKSSARGKKRPIKYKFVDQLSVRVHGGKGGDGCVSFEVAGPGVKTPSGGHGGAGGNVWVVADEQVESLSFERHHYNAGNGANGGARKKKGAKGKDVVLRVPLGTVVKRLPSPDDGYDSDQDSPEYSGSFDNSSRRRRGDFNLRREEESGDASSGSGGGSSDGSHTSISLEAGDRLDDEVSEGAGFAGFLRAGGSSGGGSSRLLRDLDVEGASLLVASGGRPGLGNQIHAGPRRLRTTAGVHKMPGAVGSSAHLLLELKIIADVGLVGLPNAGKSTFLGAISRARPKVAPYPFTTLRPMVGRVEYSDLTHLLVADIPGLIEGAHSNRGLGHEFLKHIERTTALIYVIDAAGSEGRDPVSDLLGLKNELRLYDEALAERPAFVLANKADEEAAAVHMERLRSATPLRVVAASAKSGQGVEEAVVCMRRMVEAARAA